MTIRTTQFPGSATAEKIREFRDFPAGWRYGEGSPPSPETVEIADQINNTAAKGPFDTDAFLGIDGDLRVTVYYEHEYLEFTASSDGTIQFVREHGNQEVDRQPSITLDEALNILLKLEHGTP